MADEITIHLTVTGDQGSPRVPLKISTSTNAADLLKLASETTKIPAKTLKLIFRGRLIASDETKIAAAEYKLEEGSVLHCMGKPVKDDSSGFTDDSAEAAAGGASSAVAASSRPQGATVSVPAAGATASSVPPTQAASTTPSDPLLAALQAMRAANSPADYQTAVLVLDKLLSNVMEHPLEEKYRRVKKQNPAFQRRLGGITGGEAVLLAAGFVSEQDDAGVDIFLMHASEDAWPKLQATKALVERAVREVNAARSVHLPVAAAASAGPSGAPFGAGGGLAGLGGMPAPDMERMRAALMSNPAMMQNMLQDPMLQNMMRNDPRVANNPMMQRALQEMATNPQMMQQMTQAMQNPQMMQQMQAIMQNPQMMEAMEQQMQGTGMQQLQPPAGNFPNFMPPMAGAGANNNASRQSQQQQQQGSSDEDLTEEEMIAEAIRRSMQDQHPPS